MKNLFILFAALLISGLCPAQFEKKPYKYEMNIRTGKYDLVPDGGTVYRAVTALQTNNGDTLIIKARPGTGITLKQLWITLKFTAGTAYQTTGADTTIIYCYHKGAKHRLGKIENVFFTEAGNKSPNVPIGGDIDANSPIWIDIGNGLSSGTGTWKIILDYRNDTN